MTNHDMETLVRWAVEVEALEQRAGSAAQDSTRPVSSAGPLPAAPVLAGSPAASLRMPRSVVGVAALAAAACLVLAVLPSRTPQPLDQTSRPLPGLSEAPVPIVMRAGPPAESCVVITVQQRLSGECECVNLRSHAWDRGRRLNDVEPDELIHVGLGQSCSSAVERMLVLALSGPPEQLPSSPAEAEQLVACLGDGPSMDSSSGDASSFAKHAQSCVPEGVTVLAQAFTMDRR
ncbi:MAG: hypothetical protein V3T70_08340 [Phycisphaerae bacterium]